MVRRWLGIVLPIYLIFFGVPASSGGPDAPNWAIPLENQRAAYQARIDLALDPSNTRFDVLTFNLQEDEAGLAVMAAALDVVRRGGTARIGYDAYSSRINPKLIAFLRAENVDIRVFRPVERFWEKFLRYGLYGAFRYFNIRLHDKVFLTDGGAVVGSANYSSDYWLIAKRSQTYTEREGTWNFRDREIYMRGPIEEQMRRAFDQKWSMKMSWAVADEGVSITTAERREFQSQMDAKIFELYRIRFSKSWNQEPVRISHPRYVQDSTGPIQKNRVVHREILALIRAAKTEIVIENPYVLLPDDMRAALEQAIKRGVRVVLYSNAIGGSDENEVDQMFRTELKNLIEMGVEVHLSTSSFVFHGKVIVVDQESIYWGSYNFDHRSKVMNSENGVLFRSEEIARSLSQLRKVMGFEENEIHSIQPSSYQLRPRAGTCRDLFSTRARGQTIETTNSLRLKVKERFL